jgi:small subunit ribosomal protein S5e
MFSVVYFPEDNSNMATEVAEIIEEDTAQFEAVAPVVTADLPDIKLFGRWSCDEVQVSDMSLQVRMQ